MQVSTFKNQSLKFKVGEELDEQTLDGRAVKSVFSFENDDKLIQEQTGEVPTTIVREFKEDEVVAKMSVGDIVCTRTYKVVA